VPRDLAINLAAGFSIQLYINVRNNQPFCAELRKLSQ
jgi:hypothetical protein